MAQLIHGAIEFAIQFPECTKHWHQTSNYVAVLAVDNEDQLISLIEKAKDRNIKYAAFREPDQDNAITAVVLEPGFDSKKLSSYIKLAGK